MYVAQDWLLYDQLEKNERAGHVADVHTGFWWGT